jgi:hypothetical protein
LYSYFEPHFPFLAYFPYFEKIKVGIFDYGAVCVSVCVSPIVARQWLGKNLVTVARQRLGKNLRIVARQQLGRNVAAVTDTHATREELLDASFSVWPMPYQVSD